MKPGSVDSIISSPPYAETLKGDGTQNETAAESRAKRVTAGGSLGQSQRTQGYGSKGNLGNLKPGTIDAVVSSPPFSDDQPCASQTRAIKDYHAFTRGNGTKRDKQMQTPGNLGNLKPGEVEAIISSPPFEKQLHQTKGGMLAPHQRKEYGRNESAASVQAREYGKSEGQLGNDKGETFWQAARQIVSECHKILKPGGHAIWVVKAFVRKGKIVDFPGDWRRLCEAQGFRTVCEHHAMLIKETRHNGLFEEIIETKERKSFFRRLAEKKGSPKIDWEVVLCTDKL